MPYLAEGDSRTRESRTVPFDRDVNAHDLLGIVMDFMAGV